MYLLFSLFIQFSGIEIRYVFSHAELVIRSLQWLEKKVGCPCSLVSYNMYGLLTKCEVKMTGYWPSSFFVCLGTEMKSRSINSQKKNDANIQPSWPHTWSIKDLLYGFRGNFSCGILRVVPSGQDGSILPARVANHSARFDPSCLLAELAI